jgi:hypothetical protein
MEEPGTVRDPHFALIRQEYLASARDFSKLFQVLVDAARDIGMESALQILEKCIIEKRKSWVERAIPSFPRTGNPLMDAFRLFYEDYLGLSIPSDGGIVESSSSRLVMRWWNECPTLNACQQFGLDTRTVCRRAYHSPVQVFLDAIDGRLKFDRNYASLRPHTPYCEEIITLQQ